jgi:hypothetical protein
MNEDTEVREEQAERDEPSVLDTHEPLSTK